MQPEASTPLILDSELVYVYCRQAYVWRLEEPTLVAPTIKKVCQTKGFIQKLHK